MQYLQEEQEDCKLPPPCDIPTFILQMCSNGDQLYCISKLGKSCAFYWCCQQGGEGFWNEPS